MKCENCGHTNNNPDATFCAECGQALSPGEVKEMNEKVSKKMKKSTIALLSIGLLMITGLTVFFFIGKAKFTPEKTVEAFESAVKNKDYKQVEALMATNEKSFNINHKNTKSMVDFLNENPVYLQMLNDQFHEQIKALNESKSKHDTEPKQFNTIYLTQEGKRWLFFDDYHFIIKPGYIQLATEGENLALYINDEQVGISDGEHFKDTYGPYMLGEYTVKAVFENDYVTTEEVEEIELINTEIETSNVTFDLNTKEIEVSSSLEDYDLYINGEKTDLPREKEGKQSIGEFPLDGSVTIQIGKEYPWANVVSDEKVIDTSEIVFEDLQPLTAEEQKALMEQVNTTLTQYVAGLSKNDPKLLKNGGSDQLKDELTQHIEKMSDRYAKTTGKVIEIRYNKESLTQPDFDEELKAYTMTLESQILIQEKDGIIYGWTNFGHDDDRDAAKFSRDLNVFFDEEKAEWVLDSTNVGYYFVFDRDAEVFEIN